MTREQLQDQMFKSVARSMEAEGADYERVLGLMRNRAQRNANKK